MDPGLAIHKEGECQMNYGEEPMPARLCEQDKVI